MTVVVTVADVWCVCAVDYGGDWGGGTVFVDADGIDEWLVRQHAREAARDNEQHDAHGEAHGRGMEGVAAVHLCGDLHILVCLAVLMLLVFCFVEDFFSFWLY